jgi:hypothetical protein
MVKEITQNLIDEFDGQLGNFSDSIEIFRRSPYGYRIMLEIMAGHFELQQEKITLEHLSKKVVHLASRITVNNMVKLLKEKGLITIHKDSQDQRLKIIRPSDKLLTEYHNWIKVIFKNA